jgi:hypothetical protein
VALCERGRPVEWLDGIERRAERTPLDFWSVTFTAEQLAKAGELNLTRRRDGNWENFDHRVEVEAPPGGVPRMIPDSPSRSAA